MITDTDIKKMADIIVERFQPEKIILFGSYARGQATEDSDVDLLVIKETEKSFYNRSTGMRLALLGFRCGIDILVHTAEEFEEGREEFWNVLSYAARDGKVLYDRCGAKKAAGRLQLG